MRLGRVLIVAALILSACATAGGEGGVDAAGRPIDAGVDGIDAPPVGGEVDASSTLCEAADRFFAQVVEVSAGGASNTHTDGALAEGAPDCGDVALSDVSLGGGFIVFDLGCSYPTGAGADLRVWESDGSYPPCSGSDETFEVSVSSDGVDYTDVGQGSGPTDFDVTELASFRFVRVDDPGTSTSGTTPGPDIDALELLQAQ
jgi:hypothetical protein